MATEMKHRDIAKKLKKNGCTPRAGKGDHEVWKCPCGQHIAVIVKPGVNSPGVVRDTIKKMECLPKGWLQ